MGGFAWVTLATNDSYSLGALVLANSLKQVGTNHQLAVLVTPGVTNSMRQKLIAVFNVVQEVNILDSKDEANLRLLKRPELGVTFTKLHCWRLTQFDKCVFLDADTLVVQNCDELFEREELSAAPDVGWPDCFNSGVFVYRPSNDTYEKLVQFALEKGSFDGGDQGLLNLYFSDWASKDISKHLPFIYNLCSTACYSYLPAFKQFGSDAKIIHFIGNSKPWLQYFDTETRRVQPSADVKHLEAILQHWWNIFCSLIHPQLTTDMSGLAGAFAQLTLGAPRTAEQSALDDHLRRQGWEIGNIDYMGKDSFDNIWSKICETLSTASSEKTAEPTPSPPSTTELEKTVTEEVAPTVPPPEVTASAPEAPAPAPEIPQSIPVESVKPTEQETPKVAQSETETPQCPLVPKPIQETVPTEAPQCLLPSKPAEPSAPVAEVSKTEQAPAEIPQAIAEVTQTIKPAEVAPTTQAPEASAPATEALVETSQALKSEIPTAVAPTPETPPPSVETASTPQVAQTPAETTATSQATVELAPQAPAKPSPTEAPAKATPTPAPAEALPTQAPAEATPTQASVEALPTQAPAEATLKQAPAKTAPTQVSAEPAPTQAAPTQVSAEAVPTQVPAEPAPTQVPAEPVPTQVPTEPVPKQVPAKAVPTQVPAEPAPTPQAPAKAAPVPQAPVKTAPAPQAPVKAAPAPQAPAEASPKPQTPTGPAPTSQAPAEPASTTQAPVKPAPPSQTPAESPKPAPTSKAPTKTPKAPVEISQAPTAQEAAPAPPETSPAPQTPEGSAPPAAEKAPEESKPKSKTKADPGASAASPTPPPRKVGTGGKKTKAKK